MSSILNKFNHLALTYIYLNSCDWKNISKLLNHSKNSISGSATGWLARSEKDISPVISDLLKNLLHNYSQIRGDSSYAILNLVKWEKSYRQKVIQGIEQLDLTGKNKLEELNKLKAQLRNGENESYFLKKSK